MSTQILIILFYVIPLMIIILSIYDIYKKNLRLENDLFYLTMEYQKQLKFNQVLDLQINDLENILERYINHEN